MDSSQFSQYLQKFSQQTIEALPAINEKVALNAYAMMRDRIVNKGTIGENESLGEYSDNPLPAFFFKGKALNNSGQAAYLKAQKSGDGLSYKDWRAANNRPTDHVTLSFSGTTFNDIGVVKVIQDGIRVSTQVGAKDTKSRESGLSTTEIVGFLKDQYGEFIRPNKEETAILKNTLTVEVNKLIQRIT